MTTKLTIRWDGDTLGLREHALSLSAWQEALIRLLAAVRWTASGMISEGPDDPNYGTRGGRFHKRAAALDLQLTSIRDGCVNLEFLCVMSSQDPQQDLFFDELPRHAVERFLDDVEAEADGRPRSGPTRKFLRSLPPGVQTQTYALEVDGRQLKQVEIREANLPVVPENLPGLRRVSGHVVGVGFEPGSPSIILKSEDGTNKFSATPDQVEQAIQLRDRQVVAMCVTGSSTRVLWIAAKDAAPMPPPGDQRLEGFKTRWAHTLARLAQ